MRTPRKNVSKIPPEDRVWRFLQRLKRSNWVPDYAQASITLSEVGDKYGEEDVSAREVFYAAAAEAQELGAALFRRQFA